MKGLFMIPGEYLLDDDDGLIEGNKGRRTCTVLVCNTGDRPIQVGSHFHFFEVNRALAFHREDAYGMRLDIPAGTAVRFEPGDEKEVLLTEFAGNRIIHGLNGLIGGSLVNAASRASERAREQGFQFAREEHS